MIVGSFASTLIMLILGQMIADAILEEIASLDLNMKNCYGQAYDGAANMSGAIRGAATIISNKYPNAQYQHCKSHILNLSLMKACTYVTEIGMAIVASYFFPGKLCNIYSLTLIKWKLTTM